MIDQTNLLSLKVIPYMYHCHICKEFITTRLCLGIRTDTNYYFCNGHNNYAYAEFIHGMNRTWKPTKES